VVVVTVHWSGITKVCHALLSHSGHPLAGTAVVVVAPGSDVVVVAPGSDVVVVAFGSAVVVVVVAGKQEAQSLLHSAGISAGLVKVPDPPELIISQQSPVGSLTTTPTPVVISHVVFVSTVLFKSNPLK
jgi:hypothetical protein